MINQSYVFTTTLTHMIGVNDYFFKCIFSIYTEFVKLIECSFNEIRKNICSNVKVKIQINMYLWN